MRTQSQHFSPGGDTFTAKELPNLSYLISQWSSRGFQKFYESGVFDDMVRAVKEGCLGTISVKSHGMIRFSDNPGNVSLGQIKKILEQLPEKRWKDFYFSFVSWTFTAGWWEDEGGANRPVDWLLRDDWREEMGLEPITRTFTSKDSSGRAVKVHLLKGYNRWPEAPEGFRFATMNEIEVFVFLSGPESILIPDGGVWKSVYNGVQGSADFPGYTRNLRYLYPVVKN